MRQADGFSLLELIVTLALAAALAGGSVLSYQSLRPGLDLAAAARQVAMDLNLARMRAVAANVNCRIRFATGTGSYQPERKNGDAYRADGAPVALRSGIVVAGCTAPDHAISFRPRGTAANFGTVTLRNGLGENRYVVVDIAGQVRVQ